MTNRRNLFKFVMQGDWDEVVKIYKDDLAAPSFKITRSGSTPLHVAVSDGKEDIVAHLIEALEGCQIAREALEMQTNAGDTPLHIAASKGNAKMCKLIASVDPMLIGIRNKDGETPLFLAALHGKKDAFLYLHHIFPHTTETFHCRRNDGNTILHCAIAREYFDLAFHIIQLYDIANHVNEEGSSPLHVLATKPSAFESGSNLGRLQKMVYKILFVDKLKANEANQETEPIKNESKPCCPQTLVKLFHCITLKDDVSSVISAEEEIHTIENPTTRTKKEREQKGDQSALETREKNFLPPKYVTCFEFVMVVFRAMLDLITGLAYGGVTNIRDEKRKHTWSVQVLDELLQRTNIYEYEDAGRDPSTQFGMCNDEIIPLLVEDVSEGFKSSQGFSVKKKSSEAFESEVENVLNKNSPILIAAKHGITEIVEKILEKFPVAIHDTENDKKNIVLIAVENRQLEVYKLLLRKYGPEGMFQEVDKDGNGALHIAAKLTEKHPWPILGDAIQMQWEIKWLKYMEKSVKPQSFVRYNSEGMTPDEIFVKTHMDLAQGGLKWLSNTSKPCSVVAGLFLTVAFNTSTTMPGGAKPKTGTPYLEHEPAFDVFAISSMVTFYSSVIAVVMFLSILTLSGGLIGDFEKSLPRKLLLGLTALYVSIASTLISFCTGHFFILRGQLKEAAVPVYSVICLLVTFFAIAEFPLYFQLAWATFKKVPQRR